MNITKEQERAIREYQRACDFLFLHSAIDTKPLVRLEAEDNYTKAWQNLLKANISPNQDVKRTKPHNKAVTDIGRY